MDRKAYVMSQMVQYNTPDTRRILHAMKVTGFAQAIAAEENINEEELEILVCASILHDIGIHMAEKLYNSCSGFYQQKLGPSVAATFLEKAGFNTEEQGEICYLIAHHHTYTIKDNTLLQILIEADTIVNVDEGNFGNLDNEENLEKLLEKMFVTEAGKKIFKTLLIDSKK